MLGGRPDVRSASASPSGLGSDAPHADQNRTPRNPRSAHSVLVYAGKTERTELDELRRENARLARTLGKKTMELEASGELLRGWE